MNYLAHFHLASSAQRGNEDSGLIVGALLGDYIKGPLKQEWPSEWERGIALHRRIDALTDGHDEVSALLSGLPAQYRRYGGIMFDVCFDYCLVHNWGNFHPEPLPDFARQIYTTLGRQDNDFPAPARKQAQRLERYDVLVNMGNWQTVENMLLRISQRLKRDNPLASSASVLQDQLPKIETHFLRLYPQLLELLAKDKL